MLKGPLYLDALPRDFPLTIVVQTSLGNINVLSHHQALLRMVVTSFKDRKLMAVLFCPVITLLNDFPSYYFGSTKTPQICSCGSMLARELQSKFGHRWAEKKAIPTQSSNMLYKMNAKHSQQRFLQSNENGLVKTIPTVPHNLCVSSESGSIPIGDLVKPE